MYEETPLAIFRTIIAVFTRNYEFTRKTMLIVAGREITYSSCCLVIQSAVPSDGHQ